MASRWWAGPTPPDFRASSDLTPFPSSRYPSPMLLPLVMACSSGPAALDTDPHRGDALVVAVGFDPGNISPLVAPYAMSAMFGELVQPGLVQRRVGEQGLYYEPSLASEWAWNDEGTALTYTMRKGLVWADGEPIDSADVAFSHELIADPAVASNWVGDAAKISAIETPDAHTVVFRFDRPRNPLLQQGFTMRGIVPEHQLAKADRASLRGHPSARQPLASGPFTVARWDPDSMVVLEPNPRAPDAWSPRLERIIARVLPEYSTRLIELENGGVDMVFDLEVTDVAAVQDNPRLRLLRESAAAMQYIGWNNRDPKFRDPRARAALTLAIDRQRLIDDLLTADGVAYGRHCTGTIAPQLGDWHNAGIEPLPFDPTQAGFLLREVGWVDTDGDGILDKDGEPFRFTLRVQNGYTLLRRTAVLVQSNLKAVGIEVEIELMDPNRFSQVAREHEFEAILWSFGANPKVDPSIQWHSEGRYNWYQFSNAAVDALIDEGIAATDIAQSQAAFRKMQRIVHDEQPVTFLFWKDELSAIDVRFQDVQTDSFTTLLNAQEWWVKPEQRKR